MSKRCLVFGATGAVGEAVCQSLRLAQHQVVGTFFQSEEKAKSMAENIPLRMIIHCDVQKSKQIQHATAHAEQVLQGLDVMVYCVGAAGEARFYRRDGQQSSYLSDLDDEEIVRLMNINAIGAMQACRHAFPCMKNHGGNMIIVGSMDGIKAVPSPAHFALSKSALKGMVEALAKEMGPHDIKVNLVCPGILENGASSVICDAMKQDYLKHCGLGRFGRAEEVARIITWLAEKNTYLTGEHILLDGGL